MIAITLMVPGVGFEPTISGFEFAQFTLFLGLYHHPLLSYEEYVGCWALSLVIKGTVSLQ